MSGQWWMRGMIAQFLKMYSGKWGMSLVFLKSLRQHRPLFGHLILLFAVMSVSTAVAAEKDVKHSIDIQLEHCIDSNTTTAGGNTLNPTTVWMNTCTADAMNKWDKEMNEIYKKLMSTLTIKQRASLKKSQVVWLKFRDEESIFLDNFYGDFQGTMWSNILRGDKLSITKQRTLMLQVYLQNLKETK